MNMNYKVFRREQFDLIETESAYFSGGTEGNHEILPPPPTSPPQHLGPKFGNYCQIRRLTPTAQLLSPQIYCRYTLLHLLSIKLTISNFFH